MDQTQCKTGMCSCRIKGLDLEWWTKTEYSWLTAGEWSKSHVASKLHSSPAMLNKYKGQWGGIATISQKDSSCRFLDKHFLSITITIGKDILLLTILDEWKHCWSQSTKLWNYRFPIFELSTCYFLLQINQGLTNSTSKVVHWAELEEFTKAVQRRPVQKMHP